MRLVKWMAAVLVGIGLSCAAHGAEIVAVAAEPSGAEPPLESPFGIDFDAAGDMYVVELTGQRVRKIDSDGILTTVAGTGRKGNRGDGGPAAEAEFNGPHALAFGPDGGLYIADTWNNRVRRIDLATGLITGIAGTGEKGFSGDGGPAATAQFGGVYGLAFAPDGATLYLADLDNRRVRAVDMTSGIVTTVAGDGTRGVPRDGAKARSAPLIDPRAVAADGSGNVYILERGGHALRMVDRQGLVRTVVGTGTKGSGGDDGPAIEASLAGPKHLCIDPDGTVIIADTDNHVIRRYLPEEGRIVHIAGTGREGTGGVGGPPERVELNQPHGVTIDRKGMLFIADSMNDRILKLVP